MAFAQHFWMISAIALIPVASIATPAFAQDTAESSAQTTAQTAAQTRGTPTEQTDPAAEQDTTPAPSPAPSSAPSPTQSKVYWSDEITPERVRKARARRASEQEQISRAREREMLKQLSTVGNTDTVAPQLTEQLTGVDADKALAQLSQSERQVLLDAVNGTDICDRQTDIPAIQKLCEERIETRSSEFGARPQNTLSAEERLLGEGLDGNPVRSIEDAVRRLGRNARDASKPENQAVASVALAPQADPNEGAAATSASSSAGQLSPETQALVNAIVEQFGGGSGQTPQ
ncbi:MAG: hypothetical protein WBA51_05520 [Erythrobacter sp.]